MLITQSEKLYLDMTARLHAESSKSASDVRDLSTSLEIIENSIKQLNKLVGNIGFGSTAEEIQYFKVVKPKFYSKKIFIVEQFNIMANVPKDTDERVREYYENELFYLKRYFDQNPLLYQHFVNEESFLDERYFLRQNRNSYLPSIDFVEFETNGDYIYAKFHAFEQLRTFLLFRIKKIYKESEVLVAQFLHNSNAIKWTDDKVKLVELAYGIYFMKSVNDGRADISDIVYWLEESLNVDLGVVYRSFIDISRRKTVSYTRYLDEMREAISSHIVSKVTFGK